MDNNISSNDRTIRIDISKLDGVMPMPNNADKTIVVNRQPSTENTDMAGDITLRTVKPNQGERSTLDNWLPEPEGEGFTLDGIKYLKKTCLSDNSGEAQVYLVERNGKEYVLKVYYPNFNINKKLLQTIRNFQFEMIMNIYDYGKTYVDGKRRDYELMEYLRGGTLQDYALNGDFNNFRRIALQAAAALTYCHKHNILHKDIKPGNFFFRDEEKSQLVLGDFGISSMLENDGKTYRTTQARTPIYAAPEMYIDVIDGEVEITPAADFYSLGITLFALWLGENPMSSNERLMMKQKNEGRLPRLNELPERVRMIIMGLTSVNPQSRWKYDEVERWFLGEDVNVDISSPFLRYKTFIVDPDRNLVAENVHELIPLLVANERLAIGYLYDGRIANWLDSSGNAKLATAVKDIITNRYPVDQKAGLMAAIYAMEPTYPYHDVLGNACDDIHAIALSVISNQPRYAIELQNPNDALFLWLETHTKNDVERLRSYFSPDADGRVAVLRLVYEIDADIPFLARCASSTLEEIVHAFGYAQPSDDEWHSLIDGRLLSWLYSHEDIMASESLRILTQGQPYSLSLAYKVLYNLDREAAYDLREAKTPEAIGQLIAERLKQTEHLPAEEFAKTMNDIIDPQGRFYYYAELHRWHQELTEATRCFDLNSEENRERLSAYDLRTALYRFCRILGVTPTYLLPNGTELTDGRNIEPRHASIIRSELRSGAFAQWLSIFYHEDPTRDFAEEYSYEHELEEWVMVLGHYDNQHTYYKRLKKAREDTMSRIKEVRGLWRRTQRRSRFWRFSFYGVCAIWLALVLGIGVTNHQYILYDHWIWSFTLPVGGMLAVIVGIRSFFRGYGFMMSAIWGLLGVAAAVGILYTLRFVDKAAPSFFDMAIAAISIVFMVIAHFTDFRRDTQTDANFISSILNDEDVKSMLIEPLYYTFKTRSYRYKSSKFGLLDDINDQVRSTAGESSIHYALCSVLGLILIGMFFVFSPKLLDKPLPGLKQVSKENVMEHIQIIQKEIE